MIAGDWEVAEWIVVIRSERGHQVDDAGVSSLSGPLDLAVGPFADHRAARDWFISHGDPRGCDSGVMRLTNWTRPELVIDPADHVNRSWLGR